MKQPQWSPREVAAKAGALYKSKADPARAAQAQKYFKDRVKLFGLSSAEARAIAADLYKEIKGRWTVAEAVELCHLVFPRPELEFKGLGALMLIRFKKSYPKSLFVRIKGWLAADYLDNWASVDVLCPEAVGALLVAYPELVKDIKAWAVHPNLWVRRASLVSFIKLAKRPEFRAAAYEMARAHFNPFADAKPRLSRRGREARLRVNPEQAPAFMPGSRGVDSRDDLIHKAAGWLLRETGKRDMAALEAFLLEHGPRIPRTTLRYAIERFPPDKRRALLLKTKK